MSCYLQRGYVTLISTFDAILYLIFYVHLPFYKCKCIFHSTAPWKSLGENQVVLNEGNHLGVRYQFSYEACETFCESTSGCNSFVHCTNSNEHTGDCWLKDKILNGNEPTRDDSNGNRCTTYYKSRGIFDHL